jgi:hypothetical protein
MSKNHKKSGNITIKINNNSSTGAQAPTSKCANANYIELLAKIIITLLMQFSK